MHLIKKLVPLLFMALIACSSGNENNSNGALSFDDPSNLVFLSGKVIDRVTGIPISNSLVVTSPPTEARLTDQDGYYEIKDSVFAGGVYDITARQVGYDSDTRRVTVAEGNTAVADLAIETAVNGLVASVSTLEIPVGEQARTFLLSSTIADTPFSFTSSNPAFSVSPAQGTLAKNEHLIVQVDFLPLNGESGRIDGQLVGVANNGGTGITLNVFGNVVSPEQTDPFEVLLDRVSRVGVGAQRAAFSNATGNFSVQQNTADGIWSYYGAADRDRDGNYELLSRQATVATLNALPNVWTEEFNNSVAVIGANRSALPIVFNGSALYQWPSGTVWMHPPQDGMAILTWTSESNRTINIEYNISHVDPNGSNGISWFIDRNGATDTIEAGDLLVSSTGTLVIEDIDVVAGDDINLVVDANGSNLADSTVVVLRITDGTAVVETVETDVAVLPPDDPPAAELPLDGVWDEGCVEDGGFYRQGTSTFSGEDYESIFYWHSDAACTIRTDIDGEEFRTTVGTVSYVDEFTSTPLGEAQHVNITVSQTINGTELVAEDQTIYTIFLRGEGVLYGGDVDGAQDGSSVDLRATELDLVAPATLIADSTDSPVSDGSDVSVLDDGAPDVTGFVPDYMNYFNGWVLETTEIRRGGTLVNSITYDIDVGSRRMTSVSTEFGIGSFVEESSYVIDASGLVVSQSVELDNIENVLEYDRGSNLLTSLSSDSDSITESSIFEYFPGTSQIRSRSYESVSDIEGNNRVEVDRFQWEGGKLTGITRFADNNFVEPTDLWTVDMSDSQITYSRTSLSGDTFSGALEFDSNQNLVRSQLFDSAGQLVEDATYSYARLDGVVNLSAMALPLLLTQDI